MNDSKNTLNINDDIIIPNNHKINKNKLKLWLDNSDKNIQNIALEFITKTEHITYDKFKRIIKNSVKELLENIKGNTLQFYLSSDDVSYKYKSGYWVIKHILKYIDTDKYKISIITDKNKLDTSNKIIIADDASYSGSQISNFIEELEGLNIDIFIFIPFISNTAIDVINNAFIENNINGDIYFLKKTLFSIKPLYEVMDEKKIKALFSFYKKDGMNIREYPIYFDHKVADSYSSFPLIYTYGVIPNKKNRDIILDCKSKLIPLKNRFDELDRIVFINNCDESYSFDINKPQCPLSPYKPNFIKKTANNSNNSKNRSSSVNDLRNSLSANTKRSNISF